MNDKKVIMSLEEYELMENVIKTSFERAKVINNGSFNNEFYIIEIERVDAITKMAKYRGVDLGS